MSGGRAAVELRRLDLDAVDWQHLDSFEDRFVFQTREWLEFVAATQGAEPVVAEVRDGAATVGYFTGLIARKFGLRILGSPMPGWTTAFMGFNLEPGVSRRAAVEALLEFAFGPLGCAHLELWDRQIELETVAGLGFAHTPWHGLEVDLRPSEEEIFAAFKSECRTAIRKGERSGLVVQEADPAGFVDEFYPQLEDVFSKQELVPPYGRDRIEALIEHVHPSGRLLLLEVRDPDGRCIASGIFPGTRRSMHFLIGASWREHQRVRPNEALMWAAMRAWRERGARACDLGGYMSYKRKYRGADVHVPQLRKSRSWAIGALRDGAAAAHSARQKALGRLRSRAAR